MKKILLIISALVLSALLGFLWWKGAIRSVGGSEETRSFLVTKGSSASQVANKLEEENLVRSSLAFKFYVQLTGRAKRIPSGEFELSSAQNLFEIVGDLLEGPKAVWTTVPEGLRREEIVERFVSGLSKEGEDATNFRKEFLGLTLNMEGKIFPDTYLLPKTITAAKTVALIESTFEKRIALIGEDISSSSLTFEEIIILASLLERETITEEEKPVVAGILMNRLNGDWPLQVDATVQYALASIRCKGKIDCDWWPKSLTRNDLETKSSFNTYKNQGLPSSPIANPGLNSIKAAASPETTEYWFYLHDNSGKIRYGKTIEEHNANVRKYLGK